MTAVSTNHRFSTLCSCFAFGFTNDPPENQGQRGCPHSLHHQEGGGQGPLGVHLPPQKGSLHVLQLQQLPHRETDGHIPIVRGVCLLVLTSSLKGRLYTAFNNIILKLLFHAFLVVK